ncbi:sulfurtransferase [Crocinitomix catalasitica]|uniref:sulfurtransferase n=1 Tax=Crocinitomix catalasitica TaxID=184607 RepID=UPI00047FE5CF|nr:sulfurtransferase [Crocinitomix catalasitica]
MNPIIHTNELKSLFTKENLVLIDARSGKDAMNNYAEKHIKKAIYIDLNKDLSALKDDAANGGRHPLPSVDDFIKTLSHLGITNASHVVVYDDKSGANAAARFWWMLKSLGHQKVQVIDGGIQAAESAEIMMESRIARPNTKEEYQATDWNLPLIDINAVEVFAKDNQHIVIDVRESGRYNGEFEPIDLIAGHIPGSINLPFEDLLTENGLFKSKEVLREKFDLVFGTTPSKNIAVHCGSGVTACHLILAMDYAGLEIPKLYVGSWSEWSRNNKPIAKEV